MRIDEMIVRLGKYEKHNRTIIRQLINELDMNSFKSS